MAINCAYACMFSSVSLLSVGRAEGPENSVEYGASVSRDVTNLCIHVHT